MEYLTHRFPFFAVISSGLLPRLTVAETAVLFYLILKIIWLKFLLIWRLFRLWAMADGVDAPENMQRCMSNNNSLEQFWSDFFLPYYTVHLDNLVLRRSDDYYMLKSYN